MCSSDLDNAIRIECTGCHAAITMNVHAGKTFVRGGYTEELTCMSCHMPYASKSATAGDIAAIGPNARMGDIKTHIFNINTDAVDYTAMFTPDGSAVLKDGDGEGAVTLDFVCLRCHNGIGNAMELDLPAAASATHTIHNTRRFYNARAGTHEMPGVSIPENEVQRDLVGSQRSQ